MLKKVELSCICIVLILALVAATNAEDNLDVPISKLSQNVGAPTLKFLYWYAKG